MKKICSCIILVILICALILIISDACARNNAKSEINNNRMILVESRNDPTGYSIYYDKFTNVMYFYSYNGGLSPIYNSDGSLYLYGTPKCVG